MFKNVWSSHVKAICWKELKEIVALMKVTILLIILSTNVMQYMTMAKIINNKSITRADKGILLGSTEMYMTTMVILFLGHLFVSKFIHEERKNKTIVSLLSIGVNKSIIWYGKMLVTIICSVICSYISVLINIIFVKLYFGYSIEFNQLTTILTFIAMPLLSIGMLTLISTAYWYFDTYNMVTMIFPMVSYFGVWNLSFSLYNKYPSNHILVVSFIVGLFSLMISYYLISKIPKSRISGG